MRGMLDGKQELIRFTAAIRAREPLIFSRFSDGELEILRGHKLEISQDGVLWSRGQSNFQYPRYDHKSFNPERDVELRARLLESARYKASNYFKGIPTKHNKDPGATQLMYELNGLEWKNLTFTDLWINSNYQDFLKFVFSYLVHEKVVLLSNYRAKSELISSKWTQIDVVDGALQQFDTLSFEVIAKLEKLEKGSIILSSASSLSNIIALEVAKRGLDVLFLDIGTALHPFLGLEDSRRLYLSQLKPWRIGEFREKIGYLLSRGKLKW
jgi:hypothetical protein